MRPAGVILNRCHNLYMTRQQEESELIRQFLLGDLDEGRREQMEERLLTDAELQEQVEATRGELADEYVFGLMAERDLQLFESNVRLTPEQSHELRLSHALRKYVETTAETAPAEVVKFKPRGGTSSPRWWAAAAAVIIVVAGYGGWTVYHNRQVAAQLERLRSQRLKVEQELAVLNRQNLPASDDPSVINLTLASDIERSEGDGRRADENRAVVSEGKNFVLLRLPVKDKSNSYRAVIETDDGADIYTVNDRKAVADGGGRVVELLLPGRLLPTGNYQVTLVGVAGQDSEAVTYPFQVIQK